jgi:predicted nucleotide-binding protein (sugar kinase/HSP70/actin superfamily)
MSEFFQSEIVRDSIKELEKLQQEIIEKTFEAPFMSGNQKKEHVALMRTFLEKQKNLYFRLSLSDDPEAIEMKERIQDAAKFLGMDPNLSMTDFFVSMEATLDNLDKIAEM